MENRIMVYFKTSTVKVFKVILQKLELLTNFFKTFPDCSLPSTISKNNKNDWSPCSGNAVDVKRSYGCCNLHSRITVFCMLSPISFCLSEKRIICRLFLCDKNYR